MKLNSILCAGILLLAVLICGCTTTPQESSAAVENPDLIGNWTGTMTGYEYGEGYTNYAGALMTLSITEQQDRIFSGEISFTNQSGYPIWEPLTCAGVLGPDSRTLTLVEEGGGHSSGSLIAPDEIEVVYLDAGEPFSIAINSLKRS
ncbi:hypothetical protein L1S32_02210 [Methanogenium sp. S4BF]|uniref:hypothetical protein n=1 Tax=Methanogenium sp. S4BF TaxID=1789226 RepID=UPI0024160898|nr:hypothetical protein [Methanogenium sp. S4BF]WFN34955.1 hypothetical protein L1S32_02210 [Methanogenium sp. S4BF]